MSKKARKTYHFAAPTYGYMPRLAVIDACGNGISHEPTESTYARFVALANSGNYSIAIAMDDGVAWEMRRK